VCADGEKEAMSFDLLYPAIIVFAMLIVGLVMTVIEFNKFENDDEERKSKRRADSDSQ
jgi:hypothetical protein